LGALKFGSIRDAKNHELHWKSLPDFISVYCGASVHRNRWESLAKYLKQINPGGRLTQIAILNHHFTA
jgi:hypothetical protein